MASIVIEGALNLNRVRCEATLKNGERVRFCLQWRSGAGIVRPTSMSISDSDETHTKLIDLSKFFSEKYPEFKEEELVCLHTLPNPKDFATKVIEPEPVSSSSSSSSSPPSPYAYVFWVKARFDNGDFYLSRGQGYKVEYLRVPAAILQAHINDKDYDWSQHLYPH